MDVQPLPIDGAKKVVPDAFRDDRGYFKEIFRSSVYARIGVPGPFVQDNVSVSRARVLRGLHGDMRMAKLVQVLRGKAFDVIADVRAGSPSYGRWTAVTLEAAGHAQIYIPAGCLHGFLALEDDTLLLYKQTAEYDPAHEIGIAWNDPDLAIEWPLAGSEPLLSAKDRANPTLRERGLL
ncbi:MAG TPA: dTDP-4-dehydrorhamnose 3,5-epimerase [Candidatus Baltobacteraceae bacterium]|nr:dTDP-4-dehydrorhamnose 3,5-epimerase [Candidatus Baltobacteraceae bacterium]